MVFGIVFGISLIVISIIGFIALVSKKKNSTTSLSQSNLNHYLDISDRLQEIYKEQAKIFEIARKKMESLDVQYYSEQFLEMCEKQKNMISDLIKEYDGNKSIDSDFIKLLEIYKTKNDPNSTEFLAALQICKDKNIVEIKEYISFEEEKMKMFELSQTKFAEHSEWFDASELKPHDVWMNPECEELYNKLLKLENEKAKLEQDTIFKEQNERIDKECENIVISKEKSEKIEKWNGYYLNSFSAIRGRTAETMQCFTIGRKEDRIAIWDNNYEGIVISIDDVVYFQVEEKIDTYNYSSGKPSKLGTALNEAIWGTAVATTSAMNKMAQNSNTYTKKTRKAKLYFKFETGIAPLEVISERDIDKLIAMMPEKQR